MDFISAASPHDSQQTSSTGGMDNGNPDDWLDIALGIAGPQDDWFLNIDGGDTSLFFAEDKSLPAKPEKVGMNSLGKASLLRSAFSTGDLQSLEIPSDFSPRWAPMASSTSHRRLESVPENATSNAGLHPTVDPISLPTPQPTPTYPNTTIAPPTFQEQKPQLQRSSTGSEPLVTNLESLSIEQLEAHLTRAQQQQQQGLAATAPSAVSHPTIDPAANPFLNNNVSSHPELQFPQQPVPPTLPPAAPSLVPPASQPPAFPQIKQSSSSQDLAAMANVQNGGNGMYGMMGGPMPASNGDTNSSIAPMPMPFMMPPPHNSVMPPQAFHAYTALMNPSAAPLQVPPPSQVSPVPNLAQQPHQPLLPPLTAAALQHPPQPQQAPHMQPNGTAGVPSTFPQAPAPQMSSNTPMDFSQGVTNRSSFPVSSQMNDLGHAMPDQNGLSVSTGPHPGQQPQQQPQPQQQLTSPHAPLDGQSLAPRGLRKSQSCMELASWRSQSSLDLTELVKPAVPGKLTPEERAAKIMRYRQKRNERNFNRTIKYQCRKTLADTRPRVRGRFARNNDPESVPPELTKKALREKAKGGSVKMEGGEGMQGANGLGMMGGGMMNGTGPQGSSSITTTTSTDDSLDLPSISDPMAMLVDSAASSHTATSAFDYLASANSAPMMAAPPPHMYPQFNHFMHNQSQA